MTTTHEALELADHPGTSFAAQEMLRRQHARIEALERGLEALVEGHDMGGLMSDADAWKEARALLTKKD